MASSKVSLKLLIDKKNNRVLYAEARKEFIDFLFNILTLPVGTFIPLLKQEMVGSLGNIYNSINNLSLTYLNSVLKNSLLNPKVYISCGTRVPLQLPNVLLSQDRLFYKCDDDQYISDVKCTMCSMRHEMHYEVPFDVSAGVGGATYMVMDDLEVKPLSTISIINLINKFHLNEDGALEEKEIDLAKDAGVKLLKASLLSKTILTDVLLPMLKPDGKQESESERETTTQLGRTSTSGVVTVAAPAGGGAPAAAASKKKGNVGFCKKNDTQESDDDMDFCPSTYKRARISLGSNQ